MPCRKLVLCLLAMLVNSSVRAADWPQFMRVAEHSGDAADEALPENLGLLAQVSLGDAVTTAPAIVNGQVFVINQMGTAFCIDPRAGRIVWQTSPEGGQAFGSNTSSACVVKGRVYYGTTAGNLHILDAQSGAKIRSIAVGWPITGSLTHAGDAIYFQTLGATLHCIDLDGKERWRWDHYQQYVEPKPERFKGYHPGSYDRPHYGGGDVAVSAGRVVTSFGWDQVCLIDRGDQAELAWCNRAALGKDDGLPMNAAIADGWVYTGFPGVDGHGNLLRVRLADGTFNRKTDEVRDQWALFDTPAVRGQTVFLPRHVRGVTAHEFGKGQLWSSYLWSNPKGFTPSISSPALTKDHCLFTTMAGELIAVPLTARGSDLGKLKPAPFRFRTPHGKPISSSPAVADGLVAFGCDDGYLYVLAAGGELQAERGELKVHQPRSKAQSATGQRYAWPSAYGNPGNTNFVNDKGLQAPFRLRWAVKSHGAFVGPLTATDDDLVGVTLEGTVMCLEQQTGRLRWRQRLEPVDQLASASPLCAGGRIYVARPASRNRGLLYCLDHATGETVWTAPLGTAQWYARGGPVLHGNVLAFGTQRGEKPATAVVDAWDAGTGKPLWSVTLAGGVEPHGCMLDGVFYFSAGQARGDRVGETVAIDPKSGKVLWRTDKAHCGYRGTPTGRDGKLYLIGWDLPVSCVAARDGEVLWQTAQRQTWGHIPALGPDFFTGRGYSGHAQRFSLADGKSEKTLLGGPDHACGPVLLTASGLSIAVTASGLHLRDVATGKIVWSSLGFAPRTCSNPIAANGRVFYNPQINGMLYSFEPAGAGK